MSLDVSPTYISGDHFAPLAKPKKLLPRRRIKENWGFNAKSYGGIGGLQTGKKENVARGKGLLVSREHHHVGSGIHKFHPVRQPYQVTSLIKSACRPSDQLLPAINEADMVSIARECNLLTKKPVDKYSFNPIFDVFPRFDTSQDKKKIDESLNKRKHLSAKNLEALEDITKDVYKTTNHQRDYSKQLKQNQARQNRKRTITMKLPFPMAGRMDTFHEVSTQSHDGHPRCVVCECQINPRDFSEGLTDISICNYCKSTGIFRVEMGRDDPKATVTSLNLSDLRRLTGSKAYVNPNTATCKPEKQNLLKPALKTRSEFTRIYASPLNYLGYYSGRRRNRLSTLVRKLPQTETTAEEEGQDMEAEIDIQPEKGINLKRISIPVSLKNKEFLKAKGLYCSDMLLTKIGTFKKATLKDILPMVYFPVSLETDSTTKAEDETEDNEGDENEQAQLVPEIIKRYRSLAHERYHERYPDKIPDLRDSRINAKKHFFSGYHASVFRG